MKRARHRSKGNDRFQIDRMQLAAADVRQGKCAARRNCKEWPRGQWERAGGVRLFERSVLGHGNRSWLIALMEAQRQGRRAGGGGGAARQALPSARSLASPCRRAAGMRICEECTDGHVHESYSSSDRVKSSSRRSRKASCCSSACRRNNSVRQNNSGASTPTSPRHNSRRAPPQQQENNSGAPRRKSRRWSAAGRQSSRARRCAPC